MLSDLWEHNRFIVNHFGSLEARFPYNLRQSAPSVAIKRGRPSGPVAVRRHIRRYNHNPCDCNQIFELSRNGATKTHQTPRGNQGPQLVSLRAPLARYIRYNQASAEQVQCGKDVKKVEEMFGWLGLASEPWASVVFLSILGIQSEPTRTHADTYTLIIHLYLPK